MTLPSPLKTALAVTPALLLVAVSLWALGSQRCEMANAPSEQEWAQAQRIVLEGYQAGDVVRTAPFWADQARAGLYDLTFNLTIHPEDEELYLYDRLWILADREHAGQALEELPSTYTLLERWQPSERTTVFLVDIPEPDHVLFDIVSGIEELRMSRRYPDRVERCDLFANGGWHCGQVDPWLHVTPSVQEVGGTLRRCLFSAMHPDAELALTWEQLELGRSIEGNIGNTMPAIRADRGSDIHLRVEIDGQTRHQLTFGKWDQPFFPFSVETGDLAGQRHDLTFVLQADDFFDRWVCLRARVLR
ncbi:MAG: hypothetical protein JW797_07445 [Bradymonadales bacterium]|nr:hypothetical protein [Bradymonadales bacterium]